MRRQSDQAVDMGGPTRQWMSDFVEGLLSAPVAAPFPPCFEVGVDGPFYPYVPEIGIVLPAPLRCKNTALVLESCDSGTPGAATSRSSRSRSSSGRSDSYSVRCRECGAVDGTAATPPRLDTAVKATAEAWQQLQLRHETVGKMLNLMMRHQFTVPDNLGSPLLLQYLLHGRAGWAEPFSLEELLAVVKACGLYDVNEAGVRYTDYVDGRRAKRDVVALINDHVLAPRAYALDAVRKGFNAVPAVGDIIRQRRLTPAQIAGVFIGPQVLLAHDVLGVLKFVGVEDTTQPDADPPPPTGFEACVRAAVVALAEAEGYQGLAKFVKFATGSPFLMPHRPITVRPKASSGVGQGKGWPDVWPAPIAHTCFNTVELPFFPSFVNADGVAVLWESHTVMRNLIMGYAYNKVRLDDNAANA